MFCFDRLVLPRALILAVALCGGVAGAATEPREPTAVYILRTEAGDTLIGIAEQYLRDPSRWRALARENRLRDPNLIGTGVDLRIPLRLMRTEPAPAAVVEVTGQARSDAAPALRTGQTVAEGSRVDTGADGHVTLRLVDGTLLRLRPDSRLTLSESSRIAATPAVRSGVRLDHGRAEVKAAPARTGAPGFRIDTPSAVLGVRGTEFRAASDAGGSRGEVLEGAVAVDGADRASGGQRVSAGFGTVVDLAGRVAVPLPLLAAPDTSALPSLQEQIVVRFTLPATPAAQRWRGQIAADPSFDRVLADLTATNPELRFAGLADGDYVLRVRAIDGRGLEGRDADHRFRLKARPEPPLASTPPPRAVLFGNQVDFSWAANQEAASYRLQLSTDESFAQPLRELADLRELMTTIDGLAPGTYHWRLRSIRPDGDAGPWGAASRFELRPLPPTPPAPAVEEKTVGFAWERGAASAWDVEVARDAAFADIVLTRRLDVPAIEMPTPAAGRYFVRLRTLEADGFVSPWSATQHFDIYSCVRDGSGACVHSAGKPLIRTP